MKFMKLIKVINILIVLMSTVGFYITIEGSRLSDKAEENPTRRLFRSINVNDVEEASKAIDDGALTCAIPGLENDVKHKALMLAVKQQKPSLVRLLLDRGALTEDCKGGGDLLCEAARASSLHEGCDNQLPIILLLIKSKIDPNTPDAYDNTALSVANPDYPHRTLLLLASGVDYAKELDRLKKAMRFYEDPSGSLQEKRVVELFVAAGACDWRSELYNVSPVSQSLSGKVAIREPVLYPSSRENTLISLYKQTVQVKELARKEDWYSVDDGKEVQELIREHTALPNALVTVVYDYFYPTGSRLIFDDMERQVQEAFDNGTIENFEYRPLTCPEVDLLKDSRGEELDARVKCFAPWFIMQQIKKNKEKR